MNTKRVDELFNRECNEIAKRSLLWDLARDLERENELLKSALMNFCVHTHAAAYALESNGRKETAASLMNTDEQARYALKGQARP